MKARAKGQHKGHKETQVTQEGTGDARDTRGTGRHRGL